MALSLQLGFEKKLDEMAVRALEAEKLTELYQER